MKFNYITVATGRDFIKKKVQYAVKSLFAAGISPDDVHVVGNTKDDKKLFNNLVPEIKILHILKANVDKYKWGYMGGKRKYAVLKPISIINIFGRTYDNPVVMFDGDVLWYKNPTEFLETKADKTWFHHGKGLEKRSVRGNNPIKRKNVDMSSIKSLSRWCRYAFAYLLVKYKVKTLPEREVNSGFYILHPRDSELPYVDLEGCDLLANNKVLRNHGSAGEQCPLNAALCKLKTDWTGGSRFFCPEHEEYFDHFFGAIGSKKAFEKKVKKLGI